MVYPLEKHAEVYPKIILLIALTVSLFMFGCAARERLDSYPQRYIDRPFTLPKGIKAWQTDIHYAYYQDRDNDHRNYFFPYPLIWYLPITDNLNLICSPLPLTLQYQLLNTKNHTLGLSGGISGIGHTSADNSTDGWFFDATFSGYYKIKLGDSIALANQLTYNSEFGSASDDSWEVYFSSGPLFQIRNNLAVAPFFHLAVDRLDGRFYSYSDDEEFLQKETRWAFPISLWVGWSLHKQLNLNFSYTYKALGYSDDFEGHKFTASIVHLW